jgi:hypothetical protein
MSIWNFLMAIPAFVNNSLQLPERAQKRPIAAILLIVLAAGIGAASWKTFKAEGDSTTAAGISADPACKDKLRIHITGGAVTGINGSGIKADNADVCIETNNTKITGARMA